MLAARTPLSLWCICCSIAQTLLEHAACLTPDANGFPAGYKGYIVLQDKETAADYYFDSYAHFGTPGQFAWRSSRQYFAIMHHTSTETSHLSQAFTRKC